MKWVGVTGSRKTNGIVENDVRFHVREFMNQGKGLVTGGALGVDSIALDEALKIDPSASKIKIYIPTPLDIYSAHYRKMTSGGTITNIEVENLITQLKYLQKINPKSLQGTEYNKLVNTESYHERNSFIVNLADKLLAFQVNSSSGTQDTIEKAKVKGIPIQLFTYTIT